MAPSIRSRSAYCRTRAGRDLGVVEVGLSQAGRDDAVGERKGVRRHPGDPPPGEERAAAQAGVERQRIVDQQQPVDALGVARGEVERQAAAVGVAGEADAVEAQPVEDAEDEPLLPGERVARTVLRALGEAEAVEIDRHHRKALGELRNDRGESEGGLAEAVQQDERGTLSGLFDRDSPAVDLEQSTLRQLTDRFSVGLHRHATRRQKQREHQRRRDCRAEIHAGILRVIRPLPVGARCDPV